MQLAGQFRPHSPGVQVPRQLTNLLVVRRDSQGPGRVAAGAGRLAFLRVGQCEVVKGERVIRLELQRLAAVTYPLINLLQQEATDGQVMPRVGVVGCDFDESREDDMGLVRPAGLDQQFADFLECFGVVAAAFDFDEQVFGGLLFSALVQ